MKVCIFVLSLCIRLASLNIQSKVSNGCKDERFKCANGDCLKYDNINVCLGLPQCEDESDLKLCGNPDGYDSIHNLTYKCDDDDDAYYDLTQCPVNKHSRLKAFECWRHRFDSCKH